MTVASVSLSRFWKCEDGALGWFGIVTLLLTLIMLGLGIDVSNAIHHRTHLQSTADAAAHAALYTRDSKSELEAKTAALNVSSFNMPVDENGDVLNETNIEFGVWDRDTRTFTPLAGSREAVRVITQQRADNGNEVATYLLRFVGFDSWDVRAAAIMETYHPGCFKEGFVAQGEIDLQSNNSYVDGFCIHSNTGISLNQNNYFEDGTIVSLPNLESLDMPASGFDRNEGLEAALRFGPYTIRVLNQLEGLIDALENPGSAKQPDYITETGTVTLTGKDIQQSNLKPNTVHLMTCSGGGQVNVKRDTLFKEVVLVTDGCVLKFESGVALEDAIIATTSTNARSINAPSGLRLGKDDGCSTGGGAQLLTMGSVEVASDLQMYGGQIIAMEDVTFAANSDEMQGASIVAGGEISGTSNGGAGFCLNGMEDNFHAEYFRYVL